MKPSRVFVTLCLAVTSFLLLVIAPAYAKDHSKEYQVGIVLSTEKVNDGSFTFCGGACGTDNVSHDVHFVRVPNGIYAINPPEDVVSSLLGDLATHSAAPTSYKEWFMDQLHPGDKVLFAAKCNKHNDCQFWLPKPNHPGKEIGTGGYFRPNVAQSNTQSLCGTGKLTPAVEAQVCPASPQAAPDQGNAAVQQDPADGSQQVASQQSAASQIEPESQGSASGGDCNSVLKANMQNNCHIPNNGSICDMARGTESCYEHAANAGANVCPESLVSQYKQEAQSAAQTAKSVCAGGAR